MRRGGASHSLWVLGVIVPLSIRLWLTVTTPLIPDEAYYSVWSHHLQGGYIDHPFMVSVWIWCGRYLFGETLWGVRSLGFLADIIEIGVLMVTMHILSPLKRNYRRGALLIGATLWGSVGAIPITPDTPLLFFVTLSLFFVVLALRVPSRSYAEYGAWSAAGICLGFSFDSKYTAALIIVGLGGFIVSDGRLLWRRLAPWCSAFCALLVTVPVFRWNANHHWVSFIKQGGRVGVWKPSRVFQFTGELIGGQCALLTPLIFVCACVGLYRSRKVTSLFLWMTIPGLVLFIVHAVGDRVQANWPWVLYPIFFLVAVLYAEKKLLQWGIWSGLGVSVCVAIQIIFNPFLLSAHWNPALRLTADWDGVAHRLITKMHQENAEYIETNDYALASILSRNSDQENVIISGDKRWDFIGGLQKRHDVRALYVEDARRAMNPGPEYVDRVVDGHTIRSYHVRLDQHAVGFVIQ